MAISTRMTRSPPRPNQKPSQRDRPTLTRHLSCFKCKPVSRSLNRIKPARKTKRWKLVCSCAYLPSLFSLFDVEPPNQSILKGFLRARTSDICRKEWFNCESKETETRRERKTKKTNHVCVATLYYIQSGRSEEHPGNSTSKYPS